MILDDLLLADFKNYHNCSFSFSPKLNFIYGENGNGKTNILESISMLCYTKSFLMNSEADCIKHGENAFEITGSFRNRVETKSSVKFLYRREENSKQIICDNDKVTRSNEFLGRFPLVVLSPYDLKLTMGLQQDRRRNFDLLISQISRVYLNDLRKYSKIIKQKNSLLKENLVTRRYSNGELKELVRVWNAELLDLAVKLMIRRLDFIEEFKSYITACFYRIVGSKYVPVISYESEILDENDLAGYSIDTLKNKLQRVLEEKLDTEIKRGISLSGPHKDNYMFCMDKAGEIFEMRTSASQGEHKTFVVALKLSEFGYLNANLKHTNTGEPVLLLDDVFSELDKSRINRISELITDFNQVFVTTTDKDHFGILKDNFTDSRTFHIVNGQAE
ncbi:MAG TPA: DNA replication and repair protein RecF [Ignavibacteria bacterium]|nr:DNA replication and repair protein RecF [Ignavibacteria bacterium]HMQ98005.1 DNA replication and repair protein RecF [Ignavibacteria bacterium]